MGFPTPYDGLVDLAERAIADTHRWERRTNGFNMTFRGLAAFNAVFAGYQIAIGSWFAIVNIVAVGLMIFMLRFNRKHMKWILGIRVGWETHLEQYTLDRMTYVENGYHY